METRSNYRALWVLGLALAMVLPAFGLPPGPGIPALPGEDGIRGATKPSADLAMGFTSPGRIAKVLVKEGDCVEANGVLIQQDDEAEQKAMEKLKRAAEVDDGIQIQAAEAELALKEVMLEDLMQAGQRGGASKLEIQQASLELTIARLRKEIAESRKVQDTLEYQQTKVRVDRMRLVSPVAGRVEEIAVEAGETAEANARAIRVVQIDPLWIELQVPLSVSRRLQVGGSATVEFPEADRPPVEGKITFIASVAVSNQRMVRVELSNKQCSPAGEPVRVSFPKQPPAATAPTSRAAQTTEPATPAASMPAKAPGQTPHVPASQPVP